MSDHATLEPEMDDAKDEGGLGDADDVDAAVATAEATLAAALEALRIATDSIASTTTKAAAALASAAVKDLSPSDLDEIRAIRSSPPIIVQQVVCCVCSILGCSDEDAAATAPVAAATGSGLLPLLPAEGVPRATAGRAGGAWCQGRGAVGAGAEARRPQGLQVSPAQLRRPPATGARSRRGARRRAVPYRS